MPLQKIRIDPYNKKEVESTINNYKLQPETAKDIREFTGKVQNGEITSGEINLYIPAGNQGDISTFATRTYVGYKDKTYYEETVTYKGISPETEIRKTTKQKWTDYLNTTINETAKYFTDKVLNGVTLGYWDLVKILTAGIPSQVSSSTEVTHTAKLVQTVIKKNTYVVLDGQYYFGSNGQYALTHFQNFVNIPGFGQMTNKDTEEKTAYTPNYYKGDEKAWLSYVNGGFTEYFSNYTYGGVVFNAL
ncbi:hypothetical protein [Paenibacillus macerans]|uniref:hypothetical protein n=1 Tax=Paenibacillus macerans TaxID=44252 RepID=UPI003D3235ED